MITQREPKPIACVHCDFSSGQRGMDTCGKCDGTGSLLAYHGRYYPNTEKGWKKAFRDNGEEPRL